MKLQQVIALKFFGFELSQIKILLTEESESPAHFSSQAQVLEHKAAVMIAGTKTLRSIMDSVDNNQSILGKPLFK